MVLYDRLVNYMKDITLGQYYNSDSLVHRLDPRTKLIVTFVYMILLFPFTNLYVYGWMGLFLLVMILCSKIPMRKMLASIKPLLFLIGVTVFFNMLFTGGEEIFSLWKFHITWEGIRSACYMAMRLSFLIMGSSIMTLTTTPSNLTDGLESIMSPLKIFKVPVHDISMMMSIALRFIPILMEETDKIKKAQLARGADFESGNLVHRAKALIPIIIPLFVSAFRRANDLAMAMEARCYRGGIGRTKMKPLRYQKRDYITYLVFLLFFVTYIFLGKFVPKFWDIRGCLLG